MKTYDICITAIAILFGLMVLILMVKSEGMYIQGYTEGFQSRINYEKISEEKGYTDSWQYNINYGGPNHVQKH